MRNWLVATAVVALVSAPAPWAMAQNAPQMRLADDLDYPGEGYCIDVPGVGQTARTDLPLVVHNCLPERGSADRVVVERDGRLVMPAFDACITAFGVNAPLPGSPVLLRPCGASESFLPADRLQRFDRTPENRLRLRDTNLCLTAGPDAAPTFSPAHRWRTLTMADCNTAPPARSVWD
ncbi:MAG: RICIN domain-containing protein [Pseudomonadota bacterium]